MLNFLITFIANAAYETTNARIIFLLKYEVTHSYISG